MSFRLDFLSNTTDTSSSNTTEFYGAESVVHWVFSGTTYVFVAGRSDDGVQVFSLGQDGSLTTAFDIDATDDSGYPLDFAADLWTASIGGVDLLFVAAANDDTVSVFQIGSGGTLTLVDKVSDTDDVSYFMDFDADNVLHSGISVGMAGQYTFMFTPGNADGGVSVFQVGAGGTLTNVENEASVGANLSGAAQTLPVEINGNTFLVVGTDGNNGLTVFSVSSAGALAQVDRFDDDATSQLDGVSGLAHAAVGGTDYIFATGYIDQGVSVFEISSAGALTNIFNLPDDASLSIGQAANLHVQKIGGDTYLFVAGHLDDAISVFAVSGDGTLTEVATITDPSDFISSNDIDVDLIEDRFFAVSVGGSGWDERT